jgi:hypothetical protein
MPLSRRAALPLLGASLFGQAQPQTILLRGSWQTINIGDVAHTPGYLQIARRHLPDVRVILWPARPLDLGVEPFLRASFPDREIARSESEVASAWDRASIMVQGSAASPAAAAQMDRWRRETGKPYGFFGITLTRSSEAASAAIDARTLEVLNGASFLFTRETKSLANVREAGVTAKIADFVPDATFSRDLRDDGRAAAFVRRHGLREKQFVCVIPRLRYTPYHKIRKVELSEAEIARREAVNARAQVRDGERLRRAIEAAAGQKLRVVLCAEMTYELDILRPLLFDPLPDRVKRSVVVKDTFWLPDEAAALYRQAAAVLSCECHSPILASVQGTPAMYLHQTEDGIKGQMWPDLGLAGHYRDLDPTRAKSPPGMSS